MPEDKRLFEPASMKELLRGWLLHAHKGRDRHDMASRRYEGRRSALGLPTIVLSTVVGTSVFASLGTQAGTWAQITVGFLSVTAAVFSALQTFFDYPVRAERHRMAGAKYKAIIRELEEVLAVPDAVATHDPAWLDALRQRLDALEEEAPVVAPGIYDEVERRYASPSFVGEALGLYR
jgi:conflict system pore-forming effector with SLATT domain